MHIVDMIHYWARTVPHRPAIIQSEMVTSYQGLADAIESIGERIDLLNLSKREPVAICIANPSFMIATMFAALNCGYSAAPVTQPLYPYLAGAGLRNLIYDEKGQVGPGGRNIRFDMSWLPDPQQRTRKYRKRQSEKPDVILFTSGTTGLPKKVIESAAALDFRLQYCTDAAESHQKILIMPTLMGSFGLNRVCEVLNRGKTVCLAPNGIATLSLIDLFGVEVVLASTAQALALAELRDQNPGYIVESLKAVLIGGGKIGPEGIARIRSSLCRNVINTFGTTEAGSIGRTPFEVTDDTPRQVPFPWAEVEIVDEGDRPLPPNTEGIVRFRTPQLTEILKRSLPGEIPGVRNDWFYSGDLGSVDENGIFFPAGRGSDILNRGGVKVSGTRIAEILKEQPEIADAAACSVANASGLEEIWIAVVANSEIDTDAIKLVLRDHQDIAVKPDEVFVVDRIPRGELGKVQQLRLKELLLTLKQRA